MRCRIKAGKPGDGAALPETGTHAPIVIYGHKARAWRCGGGEAFVGFVACNRADPPVLPVHKVGGRGVVPSVILWATFKAKNTNVYQPLYVDWMAST